MHEQITKWDQQKFGLYLVKNKGKEVNVSTDPEAASAYLWKCLGDYTVYTSDYGNVSILADGTVFNGWIKDGEITIGYNNFDLGVNPQRGLAIKCITEDGKAYAFRNGNNSFPVDYLGAEKLSEDAVYEILELRREDWPPYVTALVQQAELYWLEDDSHKVNRLKGKKK